MGGCMKRVSTGIEGLDRMLKGGLPAGRCILVCGGPGSGKTIFSMQFLHYGSVKCKEPGVYVSLDEDAKHLREEMTDFGWDIENLERNGTLAIVDVSPIRKIPGTVKLGNVSIGKRDFSLLSLIEIIEKNAEKTNARRAVIDPIAGLTFQYPDATERRMATLDLLEALSKLEITTLITTELKSLALQREILTEEFLAQGVIVLHTWRSQLEAHGGIQIEKMRGIAHDTQIRPYRITSKGIEVFPEEEPLFEVDNALRISQSQS
jgi:KaiC/GvpD/RAD55 family RecA-like ATPase